MPAGARVAAMNAELQPQCSGGNVIDSIAVVGSVAA
jgi:hypothetical protein